MKLLVEALISKDNIKNIKFSNKFGITKNDLVRELEDFPVGIVVRMLEETEKQGNKLDVRVFQVDSITSSSIYGFNWNKTEDGYNFWKRVIIFEDFDLFYKKHPKYKKYDI